MSDEFFIGPNRDPDSVRLGPAVASGAEGILYRGTVTVPSGDIAVAVKMLQPSHLGALGEWAQRWRSQVELLAHIRLPGLVAVRGGFVGPLPHPAGAADMSTASLYLVMDWVEGIPLDRWARDVGATEPEPLLQALVPVAAALDLLHSGAATTGVPVVHRDVKPANILIRPDGSTVLVDLGSVRGLAGGAPRPGVVGTPGYIAPEVRVGEGYSPAADRYSLGAVAFSLLTGQEPPADADLAQLQALLADAPLLKDRPDVVRHVLLMLDNDPYRRPDRLANWVAQLRRSSLSVLAGDVALPPVAAERNPATPPPAPMDQPPRNRRRLTASVGAVVVLALIVAGVVFLRPDGGGRVASNGGTGTTTAPGPRRANTGKWTPIASAPIGGRISAVSAWTGTEMLVWGGSWQTTTYKDGAAYNPTTNAWRVLSESPLTPRRGAKSIWTGTELIIWSGDKDTEYGAEPTDWLYDGAAYNPSTDTWRMLPESPLKPHPDYSPGYDASWTGKEMLVWGNGNLGVRPYGAAYDPALNTWRKMAPSTLEPHAFYYSGWSGRELVAWLGGDPSHINSGAPLAMAYDPLLDTWHAVANAPAASAPVRADSQLVFLGANAIDLNKTDLYIFDTFKQEWKAVPLDGPAPPFQYTSPLWTGHAVLTLTSTVSLDGKVRVLPAAPHGYDAMVWTGKELIGWSGSIDNPGPAAEPFADGARLKINP